MKHTLLRQLLCSMGIIAGLVSLPGQAQTNAPEQANSGTTSTDQAPPPEIADGKATHGWLKAQDSGMYASKRRQTLSGPAMSRIYTHYLDSFGANSTAAPIPGVAASK